MNESTKAESPVDSSQLALPANVTNGGGILGVAVTLVVGFLTLRKRWSRDNLELTKDRAETNIIATLEKTIADLRANNERLDQNARDAWRTRAEDAQKIGELSAKVEHLTKINESLETHVAQLTAMVRRLLPEQERAMFEQTAINFTMKGNKQHEQAQTTPAPAP